MLIRRRWLLTIVMVLVALLAGGIFSFLENMTSAGEPAVPQPQGFHANVLSGEIKLQWQPVDGATSYIIYRSQGTGQDIWIASTVHTIFTDSMILPGQAYTYKLGAVSPHGEGPLTVIFVEAGSLE